MSVPVKTVYSKDVLLRYHFYLMASKKWFWSVMICATLIVLGYNIYLSVFSFYHIVAGYSLAMVISVDLIYCFCYLILPFFLIGKKKNLDLEVSYLFESDGLKISAKGQYVNETSELKYGALKKIGKKGDRLYLFVAYQEAFLVDLKGVSPEEIESLKNILYENVPLKKIKWGK